MKFRLVLSILALFVSFPLLHADYASEAIDQINLVRKEAGLAPLSGDPHLMAIAQEWAEKLATQQSLVHRSMSGLKGYLRDYGWHGMDENLHRSTAPASPAFVINSWMHSPVHHDNLLRPKITLGGIGVKEGADGLTYVVFNGAF